MNKTGEYNILACSNCGSNQLKWASGGSDSYLDIIGDTNSGMYECAKCGKMGVAIEFKSEADRKKFEQTLKEKK